MTICQTCHVKVEDGVDAHWGGVGSMGEELHYCPDHCPDPDCNPRRYPFDRLLRAMPDMTRHEQARILGMSGDTWKRAHDQGLTDDQCERYALRAKLHPFQVWPELIQDRLAEQAS